MKFKLNSELFWPMLIIWIIVASGDMSAYAHITQQLDREAEGKVENTTNFVEALIKYGYPLEKPNNYQFIKGYDFSNWFTRCTYVVFAANDEEFIMYMFGVTQNPLYKRPIDILGPNNFPIVEY